MSVLESSQPSAQLLLGEWSAQLETRTGLKLNVRPAAPEDEELLIDFFDHVAPDDLRFRFLSAVPKVGHELAQDMVRIDHTRTENLLAFDASDRTLVATAMIAADAKLEKAEVAIAVRADFKHRGIGWTLLRHAADYATARGFKRLESIECGDNREAIELEREMGFTATRYPGDATLVLVAKDLVAPQGH
jgi:GNAT superfamily N-acetyltransferase